MTEPQTLSAYFTYCKLQKNLDNKTLKAYQIDLKQFVDFYPNPTTVTRTDMELYIEHLMERYKASTVKRKIAALKAYYHYLVYEEILEHSPFEKIQVIAGDCTKLGNAYPTSEQKLKHGDISNCFPVSSFGMGGRKFAVSGGKDGTKYRAINSSRK